MSTFLKNAHFWGYDIFSRLVVIQSTQFLSGSTYLSDSYFWWSIFPLNFQNAYAQQTFQGGEMLRGALTHKYAWHLNGVVLWDHATNKVHISVCRRCMGIKLVKLMTSCKKLPNMTLWSSDQSEVTWSFEKSKSSLS